MVVKGFSFNPLAVTSGVPQVSVLGPSLFLLYINDIVDVEFSSIRLFADDTIVHKSLLIAMNCSVT